MVPAVSYMCPQPVCSVPEYSRCTSSLEKASIGFPRCANVVLSPYPISSELASTISSRRPTAMVASPVSPRVQATALTMGCSQQPRVARTVASSSMSSPKLVPNSLPSPRLAAFVSASARTSSPDRVPEALRSDIIGDRSSRSRSSSAKCLREKEGSLHDELYKEAFQRQQRLRSMREDAEAALEREEHQRRSELEQVRRERRRRYRTKDTRTHLEREADVIRKREELHKMNEAVKQLQERQELQECTFKPKLVECSRPRAKRLSSSPLGTSTPPGGAVPSSLSTLETSLQALAERQRAATASLQVLASDEAQLREILRVMHAELYKTVQHKETLRVVALLKSSNSAQCDLVRRIEAAAAADGENAPVQAIIEELVHGSKEEILQIVDAAFRPKRLAAERELHSRRLALVQELEAVEAEVASLRSEAALQRARAEGVELGLAGHARRSLPPRPRSQSAPKSRTPETVRRFHATPSNSGAFIESHSVLNLQPLTPRGCLRHRGPRSPSSPHSESCSPELDSSEVFLPVRRRLEFAFADAE